MRYALVIITSANVKSSMLDSITPPEKSAGTVNDAENRELYRR